MIIAVKTVNELTNTYRIFDTDILLNGYDMKETERIKIFRHNLSKQ